jgi:metal-dependent HD superfamily phosphatase/phosphodiesterase
MTQDETDGTEPIPAEQQRTGAEDVIEPEVEPTFTSEIPAAGRLAREVGRQPLRTLSEQTVGEFIAEARIHVPTRGNRVLEQLLERINADDELKTWWHIANLNAVARLQMNDHSWVHMQIVTNIGLKLLRLLFRAGVEPCTVTDYNMSRKDAEIIVVLGCLLHDIGMSIHRQGHEEMSLFLAERKTRELLDGLYPLPERTVIVSEALQSIISHRSGGVPLTVEAGVVRVADALDMSHGRSRVPFEQGKLSIHSLSAAAVESVRLKQGSERPINVEIELNNSSGVFQVDELLKHKLRGSGLEHHVEVVARVSAEEKRLVSVFRL